MAKVWFIIIIILSASGCYYDSEEYLFPQLDSQCDTTSVTYAVTVQPIMQQYCYRCHNNTNAPSSGANIRLEDYSDVATRAGNGSLYGSIAHQSGFSPMPKGGGQLDNCSLNQIKSWIDSGYPNN
ncbi:MAG: hypothetical protein JXJ22_14930 [Bacteroidales bacterium]|nr:hypothetical protein [Bacteroidales bacterium]